MLGTPVIFNCDIPREKISGFLDNQLKILIQKSWSWFKDSSYIIEIDILEDVVLVTANEVSLYPSIPYQDGLDFQEKFRFEK